jgi:hypothetical protein
MSSPLQDFLGVGTRTAAYRLVLPHFRGTATIDSEDSESPLVYRGPMFAERDTRAAFYIRTLLEDVVDPSRIAIEPADPNHRAIDGPAFLFGSRSNVIALESLRNQASPLVDFEFGPDWTIRCAGKTFSIADPSMTDRAAYEAATDYGVLARLENGTKGPLFLIAGLGGRATEASAYYLLNNWSALAQRFGEEPFALVLEFPAPFNRDHVNRVAEAF